MGLLMWQFPGPGYEVTRSAQWAIDLGLTLFALSVVLGVFTLIGLKSLVSEWSSRISRTVPALDPDNDDLAEVDWYRQRMVLLGVLTGLGLTLVGVSTMVV